MHRAFVLVVLLLLLNVDLRADEVEFVRDVRPILENHCYECHGPETQKSSLRLDVKAAAFKGGDGYGESIVPGIPEESPLIELVSSEDEFERMPPEGPGLSDEEIRTLRQWVESGAVWPDGVDQVVLPNPKDHWSFQSLQKISLPKINDNTWPKNEIDRFILAVLEDRKLKPAPPASPATWLRRVTIDLTGLPPTPIEVEQFIADLERGEQAYRAVVDRLLASPRYGERWAQHWLDVVRYADTHGFEVNTERPNAWPYRDYVIAAFNADTPYNRFVEEQIAGDAYGADTATGFLVTASVLLPGQIGQDEPSKRLARQDSLDEIVNNIGQTFLGVSIGCARCHDHKFDPISAEEYYQMQAFVSGVEYAEREVHTPEADQARETAERLRKEIAFIDQTLAQFVPLARPRQDPSSLVVTNARKNVEEFSSLPAKFVRFTIHDSNLHPSLGWIEPCIDEFEIYTDEDPSRNIALATLGTVVTASGSNISESHKLEHINDGQLGNARSWMSNAPGTGWVQFELPEVAKIRKVVWSRDREGQFEDRLPIAYTLEAGLSPENMTTLADVSTLRPAVNARMNIDRFTPVKSRKLRLTIDSTNRLEPCIDELEVYNLAGENVALAQLGTSLKTSGDTVVADRHEPQFLHDGQYGNSRSWMSNTGGTGWVELEFAEEQEIDRIVWGRDREGRFEDRLATLYRVEVLRSDKWECVADSTDRHEWIEGTTDRPYSLAGLSKAERREAEKLQQDKERLQKEVQAAAVGQKAFAGVFRTPDEIHLLRRGDPEQPAQLVVPAVPAVMGNLVLSTDVAEQLRRQELARWITRPDNPLTARVMMNRIWQWHFGMGLVETANDFGRNGAKPTHPELLDWLARKFVESDWSMKRMHRLIVLSATYRQSTQYNPAAADLDAGVRLLWQYPSRRMEAEAIRDSMLSVSGQLKLKMGGPGFDLFNKRGGLTGFEPVESFQGDGLRRMVYAHRVRRERDAVFGAFDCPDAGQSTPRRQQSTTPIQALNLFNSRMTLEMAAAFAKRVEQEVGEDPESQIKRVYQLALSRAPRGEELSDAQPIVRSFGLATLCRVIFNSNEFLFVP